jgi:hypothetical protein
MAANEELERLVVLMAGEDVEDRRLLTSQPIGWYTFLERK